MKSPLNKIPSSAAGYSLLVIAILAQFYFNQYYFSLGYILAIVFTISSENKWDTLIIAGVSLSALTIFFFFRDDRPEAIFIPVYLSFFSSIFIATLIILLNKRSKTGFEKNLRELESLFNYATIGIVVTDKSGRITNFNKYAENQFGYTKEEVLGSPVEILIPKNVHSIHSKHRTNYHENPQPRVMGEGRDLNARKKDGTQFPVEISLSHYRIGIETFVIAFVIDITIRKRNDQVVLEQKEELERTTARIREMNLELESKVEDRTQMLKETLNELEKSKQELSEALEKEKELSDLKSRFVTTASHEFRTPLSTILSSADLLERYNTPGEEHLKREKHIQRIKGSVSGMKNILEDFLSLGKLEEGLVQAKMQITSPEDCLKEIQDIIHDMQQLARTGQEIVLDHFIEFPVVIDVNLLHNILVNLISNAIKFSKENSVINVSIHASSDKEMIIVVKDSGIGISEEDQQHLFERFFRATNAVGIQGTGLGLHIVAKYVELMRGKVIIESRVNEGTTFSISIPQKV